MDRAPVGADGCLRGVERLVAELAQGAGVDGVAVGGAQRIEVEQGGTVADLLVGDKRQGERGVRELGVLAQTGEKRDHHSDGGLVVSAEKRCAVCGHEVLANEVLELRVCSGIEGDFGAVAAAAEDHAATLVELDLRVHGTAVGLPGGVEVTAKRERGVLLGAHACLPVGRDVGMLVELDVLGTKGAQVRRDDARHVELSWGRGNRGRGAWVRLRGHLAVANEPLDHVACRLASHMVAPLPSWHLMVGRQQRCGVARLSRVTTLPQRPRRGGRQRASRPEIPPSP